MRPYDGQSELIESIERRIEHPSLSAEELGRILIVLEGCIRSGLVTQAEADRMLADRKVTVS